MPAPAPAPAAIDVAALASQLRLGVTRLARKLRREGTTGVTPTQLSALATLEHHGRMTAGVLAAHEQVRKPTVTRLIAGLSDAGLITRTADSLDGRVAWVAVTSVGKRLLQRHRHLSNEYLAARMRRLDPGDLATLERAAVILERLTEGDG